MMPRHVYRRGSCSCHGAVSTFMVLTGVFIAFMLMPECTIIQNCIKHQSRKNKEPGFFNNLPSNRTCASRAMRVSLLYRRSAACGAFYCIGECLVVEIPIKGAVCGGYSSTDRALCLKGILLYR